MNLKNITTFEALKRMKLRDFIYPGILFGFIVAIAIIFFIASRTITDSINKAFSAEQNSSAQALDRARYALVTKKLGISTNIAQKISATETATSSVPEDKKTLTITILNSTGKSGLGATLAKTLLTAGYGTAKTGNERKLYATTTILIKESKSAYTTALLEEVKKTYAGAVASTTPETTTSDVTIIIGTH